MARELVEAPRCSPFCFAGSPKGGRRFPSELVPARYRSGRCSFWRCCCPSGRSASCVANGSLAPSASMPPFFGEDLARFERLRPRLAATPSATLLLDRARGLSGAERFFAAQYSLAPTVLSWASGVDEVIGSNGKGEPGLVLLRLRRSRAAGGRSGGARGRGASAGPDLCGRAARRGPDAGAPRRE